MNAAIAVFAFVLVMLCSSSSSSSMSAASKSTPGVGGAPQPAPKPGGSQPKSQSSPPSNAAPPGGSYTNPVIPNMADPGCILVGGAYYVVGTQRGGFDIFKSSNLRDWEPAGSTGQGTCGQCWAPNLHKFGSKFYLVFTDGNAMTSSIAVADAVTGPYKSVGSGAIPGIDGYLFQHGGQNYCFYNPIRRGPIMACATMNADWSRMSATKDLFSGPVPGLNQKQVTVEAPVCTKVGSTLFLSYSFNATGQFYNLSYATGTHPLGPWTQSAKTLLPDDNTGHGHHDIIKTKGGKWACIYHGAAGTRNLCIDQAFFDEKNKSMRIEYTPPGQPRKLFA